MKLFNKLMFATIALFGLAFTACEEDNKYEQGAPSEGIYFSDASSTVALSRDATSFSLTVSRTGDKDAAATYGIDAEYNAEIFTVPESVTFAAGQESTTLTIDYKLDMLEVGNANPFKITFAEGTPLMAYGQTTIEFNAVLSINWSEYKTYEEGTGSYFYEYNMDFGGLYVSYIGLPEEDTGLPIASCYDKDNPNIEQFRISHWGSNVELLIQRDKTTNFCTILPQETAWALDAETYFISANVDEASGEYIRDESGNLTYPGTVYPIQIMDIATYLDAPQYASTSYYDPENGVFMLYVVYACYMPDQTFEIGAGYEKFQIDGYAYTTEVDFVGTFTNAEGSSTSAVLNVSVGKEASKAKVAIAQGSDFEQLIADIKADAVESVTLKPGDDQRVEFVIPGSGDYVAASVTYDGSEAKLSSYDKFTVSSAGGNIESWENIGYGEFIDGWIIPMLGIGSDTNGNGQIDEDEILPFDEWGWAVQIEESLSRPGVYRIVDAYSSRDCLINMAGANSDDGTVDIEIDASNPNCVKVYPQYSGVTFSQTGEQLYVANLAGWLISTEQNTEEDIIAAGENDVLEENGVIQINSPLISADPANNKWQFFPDEEGNFSTYSLVYIQALDQTMSPSARAKSRVKSQHSALKYKTSRRVKMMDADLDKFKYNRVANRAIRLR